MEEHAHIVEQLGRPPNIDIVEQMGEPQTVDIVEQLDDPSRNEDSYSAVIQFYEVPLVVPPTPIDLSEQTEQCDQVKVQSVTVPMHNTADMTIQHDTDTDEDADINLHVNLNGAIQGSIGTEYIIHADINRNDGLSTQDTGIQDQTASSEDKSDLYEKSNIQDISIKSESLEDSTTNGTVQAISGIKLESSAEIDRDIEYTKYADINGYVTVQGNIVMDTEYIIYADINQNDGLSTQDTGIQDQTASFEDKSDLYEKSNIQDISIKPEFLKDSTKDEVLQATSGIKSESYNQMYPNHIFGEHDTDIKSELDDHMNIKQEEITVPVIPSSGAIVTVLSESPAYWWARCNMCRKLLTVKEYKSIHSGEMSSKCALCRKQCRQSHSSDILDKPTSINDYQDKPTSINDYQDKPTSRNDYKDKPTSINDYKDKPTSRNDYQDKPISINYYQDKPSSINEYEDNPPSINEPCSLKAPTGNHSEEKPYKCDMCGKQYKLAKYLEGHIISHSIDRLYQCNICGQCFKNPGSIKKHSCLHIAPSKVKICEFCGKRYRDTHSFINHMITHDVPMANSICQYCGKSYTESPCFMEHSLGGMRRVHGCKVCGKIYKDYLCLIKHVKVHGAPIKPWLFDLQLYESISGNNFAAGRKKNKSVFP